MNAIEQTRETIRKTAEYTHCPSGWQELNLIKSLELLSKMINELINQIENSPDCDSCEERKGDPPDYSWRD